MLNIDPNVRFQHTGGTETQDIECEKIEFSLEFIGEKVVLELLDYELLENFQGVREVIRIKCQTLFGETNWFKDFIQATDKQLVIDGTTYDVVIDQKEITFPHFKKTNYLASPDFVFKKKTPGITDLKYYIIDDSLVIV